MRNWQKGLISISISDLCATKPQFKHIIYAQILYSVIEQVRKFGFPLPLQLQRIVFYHLEIFQSFLRNTHK